MIDAREEERGAAHEPTSTGTGRPVGDERKQLLEAARAERARQKAVEGTADDPLVRAKRAADRLRAIRL